MESEQVKRRFGRCPYCRAMIYQDPNAVIYYCSKCRTPIRGKNPEPTDETEYALAQLEILSADTASVFSDEQGLPYTAKSTAGHDGGEQPPVRSSTEFHRGSREIGAASSSPFRAFHSVRTGARSSALDAGEQTEPERSGSPLHGFSGEHRPSSRRTRRPMSGEFDAPRDDRSSTGLGMDVPSSAASYRRRASPLSSQELDPSGYEPSGSARSPLTDPAFQHDLLQALDNLRKVIAAVELPYGTEAHRQHAGAVPRMSASCNDRGSGGGAYAPTRRNSRLMRRLESQLVQALPRDASTSSSSSASSSRRAERRSTARKDHCRPILGGTPFVVCHKCSEILQLPGAMSMDRTARVQCGGCGEALALTLPASGSTGRPKKIFSAPQPAIAGGADDEEEYVHTRSRLSGEQRRPAEGPLHRMLGYSSVSSVLRSRRYGEHD